jgi:hypothetical protein
MGSPAGNFPLRGVNEVKNENHFNIPKAFMNKKNHLFGIIFYFFHRRKIFQAHAYLVAILYHKFQVFYISSPGTLRLICMRFHKKKFPKLLFLLYFFK